LAPWIKPATALKPIRAGYREQGNPALAPANKKPAASAVGFFSEHATDHNHLPWLFLNPPGGLDEWKSLIRTDRL
jgi:hypothetical protein